MGFFNKYPYTDFHELNLDYVLDAIKLMKDEIANFINFNTIKYADPIEWSITSQYQSNTVVIDNVNHIAYLSTQPVPAGVLLTDTDYWTPILDLSGFYAEIGDLTELDTAAKDTLVNAINEVLMRCSLGFVTPEMFGAVGDGVTDDTVALQNAFSLKNVICKSGATYLISAPIELYSNTLIIGNGATIKLKDNTILSYLEAGDDINGILFANDSNNITINDLVIDCNDYNQMTYTDYSYVENVGINFHTVSGISLYNVTVLNMRTDSLRCVNVNNVKIDKCIFRCDQRSQGLRGEFIYLVTADGVIVQNSSFISNELDPTIAVCAIMLSGVKHVKIDNNNIVNAGRDNTYGHRLQAIAIYKNGSDITITNNFVKYIHGFMKAECANDVTIDNNKFIQSVSHSHGEPVFWITDDGTSADFETKNIIMTNNVIDHIATEYFLIAAYTQNTSEVLNIRNLIFKNNKIKGPAFITGMIVINKGVSELLFDGNVFEITSAGTNSAITFTAGSVPDPNNLNIKNVIIINNTFKLLRGIETQTEVNNLSIENNIYDSISPNSSYFVELHDADNVKMSENMIDGGNTVIATSTNVYAFNNIFQTTMLPFNGTITQVNNYNNGSIIT